MFYGAGGALGFDTLAAQTVLDMKKEYPQLRLILVLPCEDQTRGWRSEDIAVYENIKRRSDKVVYYKYELQKLHIVFCTSIHNMRNNEVAISKPWTGGIYPELLSARYTNYAEQHE